MSEVDAQHKAFLILLLNATGLLSHVANLGLNASAARTVVQCLYMVSKRLRGTNLS